MEHQKKKQFTSLYAQFRGLLPPALQVGAEQSTININDLIINNRMIPQLTDTPVQQLEESIDQSTTVVPVQQDLEHQSTVDLDLEQLDCYLNNDTLHLVPTITIPNQKLQWVEDQDYNLNNAKNANTQCCPCQTNNNIYFKQLQQQQQQKNLTNNNIHLQQQNLHLQQKKQQKFSSTTLPAFIPGVQLLKLLGKGGYGEVWKVNIQVLQLQLNQNTCCCNESNMQTVQAAATSSYYPIQQLNSTASSLNNQLMMVQTVPAALKVIKSEYLNLEYNNWQKLSAMVERESLKLGYRIPVLRMYSIHPVLDGSGRVGISMEFCGGGCLGDRLAIGPAGLLSEHEAASIARRVAQALAFCHAYDVLHLDVKPANVLLAVSGAPETALLADFGCSLALDTYRSSSSSDEQAAVMISCTGLRYIKINPEAAGVGTPGYRAPEVETQGMYSGAADAWSLGALLLEALTGDLPPSKLLRMQQHEISMARIMISHLRGIHKLSSMAREVVLGLLNPNPLRRLTVEKLLSHPWITTHHANLNPNPKNQPLQNYGKRKR